MRSTVTETSATTIHIDRCSYKRDLGGVEVVCIDILSFVQWKSRVASTEVQKWTMGWSIASSIWLKTVRRELQRDKTLISNKLSGVSRQASPSLVKLVSHSSQLLSKSLGNSITV